MKRKKRCRVFIIDPILARYPYRTKISSKFSAGAYVQTSTHAPNTFHIRNLATSTKGWYRPRVHSTDLTPLTCTLDPKTKASTRSPEKSGLPHAVGDAGKSASESAWRTAEPWCDAHDAREPSGFRNAKIQRTTTRRLSHTSAHRARTTRTQNTTHRELRVEDAITDSRDIIIRGFPCTLDFSSATEEFVPGVIGRR